MKTRIQSVVALIFALLFSIFSTAQSKPEELAQQSAGAWLALVDAGKYAASWDQAAELFKAAVTQNQWLSALNSTRSPLGKLVSRKLKSAAYTKMFPGAPVSEYVVLPYDTKTVRGECRAISSNRG